LSVVSPEGRERYIFAGDIFFASLREMCSTKEIGYTTPSNAHAVTANSYQMPEGQTIFAGGKPDMSERR
jgi:hypothetical protein